MFHGGRAGFSSPLSLGGECQRLDKTWSLGVFMSLAPNLDPPSPLLWTSNMV